MKGSKSLTTLNSVKIQPIVSKVNFGKQSKSENIERTSCLDFGKVRESQKLILGNQIELEKVFSTSCLDFGRIGEN